MRELYGVWLGRRRYEPVHKLQQALQAERIAGGGRDVVLFVEHEPVITLGRGAHDDNVLLPRALLEARGVDLVHTGRGGDVTLHAPGQLVCYPIVNLAPDRRDVRRYVRDLEQTMCRLAADFGIAAGPVPKLIGVWVDRKDPAHWPGPEQAKELAKLGAIGVRISRWITMHGYALNLSTDLELFSMIVPCGISAHGVTSVAELVGKAPSVESVLPRALEILAEQLDARPKGIDDRSGVELETMERAIA